MPTTVERIAGWVHDLAFGDIPAEVVDRARAQRRSVIAAIVASVGDGAAGRLLSGLRAWGGPGPVPVPGTAGPLRPVDACYAAAALSVALDFDDYLCFAHTGHSAVPVPLLAAGDGTGADQLTAQVAVNEVGARLGGACLIGPLNGQLWSFVHAAGAALAAGKLAGLRPRPLAHALAIALTSCPRPTVPGFMAPDTKLTVAAEPAAVGWRAARLAEAGVTGPLDVLDAPSGFLGAFAHVGLPALLGGLPPDGGWATSTLCVKPYPGCAYVDTLVDALMSLGPPPVDEVASVRVDAGLLTCGMDALSGPYAHRWPPTPVTVAFSVPLTVATVLVGGRLTEQELRPGWLAAHASRLRLVADTVQVRHDPAATARTARAMAPLLPPRAVTAGVPLRRLLGGLRAVRAAHPAVRPTPATVAALVRDLRRDPPPLRGGRCWDPEAMAGFRMTFPARVTVRLRDGSELVAEADVPRGGAGHPDTPEVVAREKLAAVVGRSLSPRTAGILDRAVDLDDPRLWRLLAGG